MATKKQLKQLDIYIDESGNLDSYSKHNLIYSVAFVMVDNSVNNTRPLSIFENKLLSIVGGEHFVHTGNLVRGEKPYRDMLVGERQDLFYILFLLSKHSQYKVLCSITEKKKLSNEIYGGIRDSVFETIKRMESYISDYDIIIVHYDNGQEFLKEILLSAFKAIPKKIKMVKTLQQNNPFMQVADLYSFLELIKYKIAKSGLSKQEKAFFGSPRKIKKDYLSQLKGKYLSDFDLY